MGINRKILKLRGLNAWDTFKPFTCFFCMSIHAGIGIGLGSLFGQLPNPDWELLATFQILNFIVAIILDRLLGYESFNNK